MNEFSAKKLGEVLAFAEVGLETLDRGRVALEEVFNSNQLRSILELNSSHKELIGEIARKYDMDEVTYKKAEATGNKLRNMRDLYLAKSEDWSNPAEILEWSGFFHGAAGVHWSLVRGVAETVGEDEFTELADDAFSFHNTMLGDVSRALHNIGAKRAKE